MVLPTQLIEAERSPDRERSALRYRMLGPLEIRDSGEVWRPVKAAKWRALLALLLARPNRLVRSDEIQDELWAEGAPRTARKLVADYVHRLRRLLGDPDGTLLRTRPHGYEMQVQPGELDTDVFIELLAHGDRALASGSGQAAAEHFTSALGLWRGRLAADVPDLAAIRDIDARFEQTRLRAWEKWARAEQLCGRSSAVITELTSLVAEHPLREGLCELLAVALYRDGRQAEALSAIRDLRDALRDELGINPTRRILQVELDILRARDPGSADT